MKTKKMKKGIAFLTLICALLGTIYANMHNQEMKSRNEGVTGNLNVYYLDVGQADCTLLESNGEYLLIDSGNVEDGAFIIEYLKKLKISDHDIRYAIGTHSHEDHIGGLSEILDAYPPMHVILPDEKITTKCYQNIWDVINDKNLDVIRPQIGHTYSFGSADFQILAPAPGKKSNANEYSVGIMVTYGKNKFLFTGDAEEKNELEMLETGIDLECDVYQVGHHGSSTSTCKEFLQAIDPVYAVISCGVGNTYGHPHAEVVAALEDEDVQTFRTDKQGTVIARSDGKQITWEIDGLQ